MVQTSTTHAKSPKPPRWPLRFTPALREKNKRFWPNRNLLDFIGDYYDARKDEVVVVDRAVRFTFQDILEKADAFAAWMESVGLGSGDTVSFQLPNWYQAEVIHLACAKIGAVLNPIIPIYRERELNFILQDAETQLMVIPGVYRDVDYVALINRLSCRVPHVVTCGLAADEMVSFDSVLDQFKGQRPTSHPIDPDALAYLLYTSGTESDPKGVEHTQNVLLFDLLNMIENNRIDQTDVLFGASPVTHVTGLIYYLILPFVRGNRVCLFDTWDAGKAAQMIEQERCTWTVGATPFLRDLLYDKRAQSYDISSLRAFRCGGADVPPSLIGQANERGLRAYRAYGCTEHPTISGMLYVSGDRSFIKSATTDGFLHPHIELKCVDPEDGITPKGIREVGEILTRGPDMSMGYHRAELNQRAFDSDGWFHTGDLGFIDEEGYLTITGRKKDIVIRKGENISTKEIEDILLAHPSVMAVAVVGVPDGERGEMVCAVVVPHPGAAFSFDDMSDALTHVGIARQKYPERLVIRDALPTTAAGKIRKAQIRSELIAAQAMEKSA